MRYQGKKRKEWEKAETHVYSHNFKYFLLFSRGRRERLIGFNVAISAAPLLFSDIFYYFLLLSRREQGDFFIMQMSRRSPLCLFYFRLFSHSI